MSVRNYEAFVTPLVRQDIYGTDPGVTQDIDITDQIPKRSGIGNIKIQSDVRDYDIGLFNYSNLNLQVVNFDGRFNDPNIPGSIFVYSRDRAKVRIDYLDSDGGTTILFRGLINEEATRQDINKGNVKFKVLSQDSFLRNTLVSGGVVRTGMTFQEAFQAILEKPNVTKFLNYSASNINPDFNGTIEDSTVFDNRTIKDSLDSLSQASNSVVLTDNSENIIVRTKTHNNNVPWQFYGDTDLLGRGNILKVDQWNTGFQRTFTTASVNDIVFTNNVYEARFGARSTDFTFDFITSEPQAQSVAFNLVDSFKAPKIEFLLTTWTDIAKDIQLFDLVGVEYTVRIRGCRGGDIPLYDVAEFDKARYPYEIGSFEIPGNLAFKVIGITHNVNTQQSVLKLRQIGIAVDDGYLV